MGFLKGLRKAFLYTVDGVENEEEVEKNIDSKDKPLPKVRLNIGDPLRRMRDLKEDTMNTIKNNAQNRRPVVTDYTIDLIYQSMHKNVERIVGKSMPVEEAKIVYKKFLEQKITDESYYSDLDLEYVKALVSYIKELKSMHRVPNYDKDELIKSITDNKYFLNMLEILDIQYEQSVMDYCIERSYIICGFSYDKESNILEELADNHVPFFSVRINDTEFLILNEVKTLITDKHSTVDKREYVTSKLKPFFNRYVKDNDIQLSILAVVIELFKDLDLTEEEDTVVNPIPAMSDIVKEDKEDNPIETLSNQVNDILPTLGIDEEFEDTEVDNEVLSAMDILGIVGEDLPSEPSELSIKFETYKTMADPRNPSITMDDLDKAIEEIHEFERIGETLTLGQFKIFEQLKGRLNLLKSLSLEDGD